MIYQLIRALIGLFVKIVFRLEIIGKENIDYSCGILCANHLTNWDPVLINVAYPKQVHYMAKVELFKIPVLKQIIKALGAFPIDRSHRDLDAIKTSYKLIAGKKTIGIFPEGTRNLTGDIKPKAGAAMIAIKTDTRIQPVYISPAKPFRKTKVIIGKSIYYSKEEYGRSEHSVFKDISEEIMNKIMELKTSGN